MIDNYTNLSTVSELRKFPTCSTQDDYYGYVRRSMAYWVTERDTSFLGDIYSQQKLKSDHNLRLRDIANPLISELADYSKTSPWLNHYDMSLWILQPIEQRKLNILEKQIDELLGYIATKKKYIIISDEQREIIQNNCLIGSQTILPTNEKFMLLTSNLEKFDLLPDEYNKLTSLTSPF